MAFETLEVRWFFDGALTQLASEVEVWFRTAPSFGAVKMGEPLDWSKNWRHDRYALVPGANDMGMKMREGRLEIKGRIECFGLECFTEHVQGLTERWAKWSYDVEVGAENGVVNWLVTRQSGANKPVSVDKRRILRRSNLKADAVVDFELTRIRLNSVQAETHWSVAFEASPYRPTLRDPFSYIVGEVMRSWPLGPLSPETSMSYPAWLLQMSAQQ